MSLAFVASPLDRAAALRTIPAQIDVLRRLPSSQLLRIRSDAVEVEGLLPKTANDLAHDAVVFLGLDARGEAWFAGQAREGATLLPLRDLMTGGAVEPALLSILAQARSLVHWHERHGFCAHCGTKTQVADAGYRRHCEQCRADHFPRTDPVIIIAVRHGSRMLLGRQASWPDGMYSTLAGFMEPGETIEDAARREVLEESGIRVGHITYVANQPWPFPSSLMIGLIGEAETEAITIDKAELQDARWFEKDEVLAMLRHEHGGGLSASHPYAIAHHLIAQAVQDS